MFLLFNVVITLIRNLLGVTGVGFGLSDRLARKFALFAESFIDWDLPAQSWKNGLKKGF